MRKLTTEEFIEKAREVHGDKYDYSKVRYVNSQTKVCIICPEHGEFWQEANSHLQGSGCSKCCGNNSYTTEEFIEKAREVHGDKYDYSKVEYKGMHKKVCIICPEHGEFWQKPMLHINQRCGCRLCGYDSVSDKLKSNQELFLERAKEIHGDKYDYSKVRYVNMRTNVCIICHKKDKYGNEHGEFWQTPNSHLNGAGCKKCNNENLSAKRLMTTEEFVERCKHIHKNRYTYEHTIYNGYYNKVTITCPIHGDFQQIAYDHLQGKGCRKCKKSKLEIEISNILDENNIEYKENVRPKFLSEGKSHLSLDFYLEKYNIGIECQGIQHFKYCDFFEGRKETIFERDKRKFELCKKNNVKLLYFSDIEKENYFDTVYVDKNDLLKEILNYERLL